MTPHALRNARADQPFGETSDDLFRRRALSGRPDEPVDDGARFCERGVWAISHNAFNITKISYAGNGAVMS
jgi:hypothetical protein